MSEGKRVIDERGTFRAPFTEQAHVSQNLKMSLRAKPSKFEELATVQKEALDQIQAKVARILTGDPNEVDAWVDISGYAELIVRELKQAALKRPGKGV